MIRKASRQYTQDTHASLRRLNVENPQEYWKIINQCYDVNKDQSSNKVPTMADFHDHFKGLHSMSSENDEPVNPAASPYLGAVSTAAPFDTSCINQPFSLQEIKEAVRALKTGKASGIDGIVNEFFKCCPLTLLAVITRWFNLILDCGCVPDEWCLGIISPIYKKKGSPSCPDNYRGVTLLSCIGKLFTSALNTRLSALLESNKQIGPEQAGFRENHSTLDHVFTLRSLLTIYLNSRRRVYAAFLDYRKAFDLVDRTSLWYKLANSGLSGKLLDVVKGIYSKAKSCVRAQGGLTETFSSGIGVRQGENLSPLLFSLFINDFKEELSSRVGGMELLLQKAIELDMSEDFQHMLDLFVLLYADDTLILSETEDGLQRALTETSTYCNKWKIEINTQKSKVVVFSRGKIRNLPDFFIGNSKLEVCFEFNYLAILSIKPLLGKSDREAELYTP